VAREWRKRLEEVVNYDAKPLEQAQGWSGVFWWDLAYAKRNRPERIEELLTSTGADYLIVDRLYQRLPPHLPLQEDALPEYGLSVVFEHLRYRVYGLAANL
jgi:hypothetical protein